MNHLVPAHPTADAAAAEGVLVDGHGRRVQSLRLSLTDRCNLRCVYCMPAAGVPVAPRDRLLGPDQVRTAVQAAVGLGITQVRLTGGEPLLRADIVELVSAAAQVPGLADLALTTNGLLLPRWAEGLASAGLRRVNISIDGLDEAGFRSVTRAKGAQTLQAVWRGVQAALDAGLGPVRLNVVPLAGVNAHQLADWVRRGADQGLDVRFLELMPMGEGAQLMAEGAFEDLSVAREDLVRSMGLEPAVTGAAPGNGPARYWRLPGAKDGARVGFITPLSQPYCDTCSRMRLTATGQVRACLAEDAVVDAREALWAGDVAGVQAAMRQSAAQKVAGHRWRAGATTSTGMSQLGG